MPCVCPNLFERNTLPDGSDFRAVLSRPRHRRQFALRPLTREMLASLLFELPPPEDGLIQPASDELQDFARSRFVRRLS